jgi:DNA-binding MarR family transcriptional regulator
MGTNFRVANRTDDSERSGSTRPRAADTDAVLAACRLLVGISVSSMAAVEAQVNLVQLRVLTMLASCEPVTLSELATAVGLHLSRASRGCDRLVETGLVAREDDPADRRSLRLTLTDEGRATVAEVTRARRAAVQPALRRLEAAERADLVAALERFTAVAGGEPADAHLWAMGWTT